MKFLYIIAFVLITRLTYAQEDSTITWSKITKLKWSDYKSPADPTSKYFANTYYIESFKYQWRQRNGVYEFKFQTKSSMSPYRSWVLNGKQSDELLEHEQLHFDISAFFARSLLFSLTKGHYTSNYKVELERIGLENANRRAAMEDLYDEQTNHMLNKIMQAKWKVYVAELLLIDPESNMPFPMLPQQ